MTLLTAVRTARAVVLASDSQETWGGAAALASTTTKIVIPQSGLLMAWAGHKHIAQRFILSVREDNLSLVGRRGELVTEVAQRLATISQETEREGGSDVNEFFLAYSHPRDGPVCLHLRKNGGSEWVEHWHFAAITQVMAMAGAVRASIAFVPIDNLDPNQLAMIALKVARDTIEASAALGGEVQLGVVTTDDATVISGVDLHAVHDALDVWEEKSAGLLPGAVLPPTAATRRDRGVRPPRVS